MKKLTSKNAQQLQKLLAGETIPASSLPKILKEQLLCDGVILQKIQKRSKSSLYIQNCETMMSYIKNRFGISDVSEYISFLENEESTKADSVKVSSDSKTKSTRSFSGFPVNVVEQIEVELNGEKINLQPQKGLFTFVSDWNSFIPHKDVIIVGVENGETFSHIKNYIHLFDAKQKYLFVSRYPQSNDLRNWLLTIPNSYIHFGDFDIAAIAIYYNEIKQYVRERASFFVPDTIEEKIKWNGNRELFDNQLHLLDVAKKVDEDGVMALLEIIVKLKRGVEQEIYSI